MSLLRPILRMAAVAALRDITWAETRVYDSDNTPLVDALRDAPSSPYIVVYTEDDSRLDLMGRDVMSPGRRNLSLIIEFGIAGAVATDTDEGNALRIPATDEGMEFAIDILESQIVRALLTHPTSPWAEVVRLIMHTVSRVTSMRGGAAVANQRWAARQLNIVSQVMLADPIDGIALDAAHPVTRFLALARDPANEALGFANVVDAIESMTNNTPIQPWLQAKSLLGLAEEGARGMGIDPVVAPDIAAPLLEEIDDFHNVSLPLRPVPREDFDLHVIDE